MLRSGTAIGSRGHRFRWTKIGRTRPTNLPALFNREGLTPEEAINVAVYEAINKSVVNINTKSTHSGAAGV